MFDLFDNNRIEITKGNTATIDITPIDNETGEPIVLGSGDYILFTVKSKNGTKVIQKTLTSDNYDDEMDTSINCDLETSDTVELLTGEYPYDCLLVTSDGQAVTFISSSLVIKEAIGMPNDI